MTVYKFGKVPGWRKATFPTRNFRDLVIPDATKSSRTSESSMRRIRGGNVGSGVPAASSRSQEPPHCSKGKHHRRGQSKASHSGVKGREYLQNRGSFSLLPTLEGIHQPAGDTANSRLSDGREVMWPGAGVYLTIPWPRPAPSPWWRRSWRSATSCLWGRGARARWPLRWASWPGPCPACWRTPPGWPSSAPLPGIRRRRHTCAVCLWAEIQEFSIIPPTWPPAPTWRCPCGRGRCCPPRRWRRPCSSSNTSSRACEGRRGDGQDRRRSTTHPADHTHLMLVWPPRSHTWNFRFLYVTVSTLKPMAAEREEVQRQPHFLLWFDSRLPFSQERRTKLKLPMTPQNVPSCLCVGR